MIINYSQEKGGSSLALDMPKTNESGIFCSFRGKFDFENLLLLEKTAWKLSTRTKYFSFHLLSVKFGGGVKIIGRDGRFQ